MDRSTRAGSPGFPVAHDRYPDRTAAGRVLAEEVRPFVPGGGVVVGIPRGGAVVAAALAEPLRLPMTLVHVRKIALARSPELAIGAMDEDGHALVDEALVRLLHGGQRETAAARERARIELERQRRLYAAPPVSVLGRNATVVLVDDGLATGATMRAALHYVRRHGARRVIVAVPCASEDTARALEHEAERLVCPWIDPGFGAVGEHYEDFAPVSDSEVLTALARAQQALANGRQEGRT